MRARTWAIFLGVMIAIAAAGIGGYQLGLQSAGGTSSSAAARTSPTLSNSVGLGPGAAGLSCKLPVYQAGAGIGTGGWITFPGGAFASDVSSEVTTKYGSDWYGLTYDSKTRKWLPVPSTWVSPDGSFYAYALDLHQHAANNMVVVNAGTGSGATFGQVNTGWQVIGVSQSNIYAEPFTGGGVWVQPVSGSSPTLVADGFPQAASDFYVFVGSIPQGGAIARIDVRNPSARVPWFSQGSGEVVGFDGSGHPIIWTGSELWSAPSADHATLISSLPLLPPPDQETGDGPVLGTRAPVTDSHGLWFSTTDGIYLYDGTQAKKVIGMRLQVAGPCV